MSNRMKDHNKKWAEDIERSGLSPLVDDMNDRDLSDGEIKKQLDWINKPLTYKQKLLSDEIIVMSTKLKEDNLYIKYVRGYGRRGGFIVERKTDEQ